MNPIGLIKKAFTIFKKKSVKADEGAPKPDFIPFEKDDNVVLVFGHSNSGKTVYFSVLYELLKSRTEFKLSPLDNPTAASLIEGYNLMRGKQIKIKEGRQVEVDGERKFPTMTSETRVLKFGLDMVGRKGLKFYTVDYKGETLSIAEPGELRAKFAEFFPYCRAALFFIDASVLDTDVLLREQIAAFQTIIHDLRDCVDKRVPIGIVITKSDFLEGYSTSNPVELISGLGAIYKGRRQESFTRGVTRVNRRRFGEIWGRTSERITRTLGILIDSMVSYNLDFQFFVVSATGGLAKKPDGSVEPPPDLRPYGIERPLMWAFKRIVFNKRKHFWLNKVKWVIGLSILWAVIFSIINLWHVAFWYEHLERADKNYYDNFPNYEKPLSMSKAKGFRSPYEKYLKHWGVIDFFGAQELERYANRQIKGVQLETDITLVSTDEDEAGGEGGGGGAGGSQQTKDAVRSYNDIVDKVNLAPVGERQGMYKQSMENYWSSLGQVGDDSTSISEGVVNSIKFYEKEYHSEWEEFNAPVKVSYEISGLANKEKVTVQIGGGSKVDFSNFGAGNSNTKLINDISGRPAEGIKFWHLNFDTEVESTQEEPDPLNNFYPMVDKGQGYRLHFEADKSIYIKSDSGSLPAAPKLNRL